MKTAEIEAIETAKLDNPRTELEVRAEAIATIETEDHLREAREILNLVADYKSLVMSTFKEAKDLAHKAHKAIVKQEKDALAPAEAVEAKVREALRQHALRIEAEARAERERAAAAEREAAAKREEAAREAAALREVDETELADAIESEADSLYTDALMRQPAAPEAPKVSGLSTRKVYRFRVPDMQAVPRRFLVLDEKAVQDLVNRMGEEAARVHPWLEVEVDFIPVRR